MYKEGCSAYSELNDKRWLEKEYIDNNLSCREVSELIGCCTSTVRLALRRNEIPRRRNTEAGRKHPKLSDKVYLEKKYLEEGLNAVEISELIGCSSSGVDHALNRLKVPRRSRLEVQTQSRELLDREWLEEKYIDEHLSCERMGNTLGCSSTSVNRALKRFGIERRDLSDAHQKCSGLGDKALLESLYITKRMCAREIGESLGCSIHKVIYALKRQGIPTRPKSETNRRGSIYPALNDMAYLEKRYLDDLLNCREIAEEVGCKPSCVYDALEKCMISRRTPGRNIITCKRFWDNKWLERKYVDEHLSCEKIGEILGCSGSAVLNRLSEFGIPRRNVSELLKENRKKMNFRKCRTDIEVALEKIFNKYTDCIEYTGDSSFWIATPKTNLNPDFIVRDKKIAIEANGNYWHDPNLNKNLSKNSIESYRRKLLKGVGWRLVVFWGTEILHKDAEAFVLSVLTREGII